MKEIVYFKICDNEAEYEKMQQHRITKNKFINSIIKKVYHYKFIIMAKYNMIEKIIDSKKEIFIIYNEPGKKAERVLKNINNIITKITYANKNVRAILSRKIKCLIEESKNKNNIKKLYSVFQESINNKEVYIDFLNEIVKSVIKLHKETPEEQSIYILMNSNNIKYTELLNRIIPNYKMINIITQNTYNFKTLEKQAEENFEPVSVLNNKRKSIAKAKYIINVDFEDKYLINYCINRTAVIFNINDSKINLKNFDGIIINNINFDQNNQEFDLKDEYIGNKPYTDLILKNIEDYKYELEGNNGKVLLDKTKKKV